MWMPWLLFMDMHTKTHTHTNTHSTINNTPTSTSSKLNNKSSIQVWSCVPCSQVKPPLVTWQQASWNTLVDLATNQSIAVLSPWASTPTCKEMDKNKTVRVMPCLRTTPG